MKRSTLVIGFDGQKENTNELSRPPESPNENRDKIQLFLNEKNLAFQKNAFLL